MPSSRSAWLLFLALGLPVLQVLGDQGISPVRRYTLEKRFGVCRVPNQRKGCVIWGSEACCRDCCIEYYNDRAPASWGADCDCTPKYIPPPPSPPAVVVVQQQAPPPPASPPPPPPPPPP
ncbi:hypothetical protein PTTG_02463, partial [Puccinia triticina 1-1 BBBD Race 1]